MSMLTSKQLIIDKFGDPTDISNMSDYDEYYYDFGVFEVGMSKIGEIKNLLFHSKTVTNLL